MNPHICPLCHITYPSPGTLRYHLRHAHHPTAAPGAPKPKLPDLEWHDSKDR